MKRLKIGLFGFGRTGKIVAEQIINDNELELIWVARKSLTNTRTFASSMMGNNDKFAPCFSIKEISSDFFNEYPVDVIIDFSSETGIDFYQDSCKSGIKVVNAISHYSESQLEKLHEMSKQTSILYSPNITIGINFLIVVSKVLKQIAPDADIEIVEEHFRDKQGISGTALRIAEDLDLCKNKQINSIRVGGIVGIHEVIFGLPNQTIRIKHEAINRGAFGLGAIYAAKWLSEKDSGIYTMEDVIRLSFIENIRSVEI